MNRLQRFVGLSAVGAMALALSGCIFPPVEVDSGGKVTWTGEATAYPNDAGEGQFIAICAFEAIDCYYSLPGEALYTYMPADSATFAQLSPGTLVIPMGGGDPVGLPEGKYQIQVTEYRLDGTDLLGPGYVDSMKALTVSYPANDGPPPVQQSVGLPETGDCADVDQTILEWAENIPGGWSKSWQQWVKNGEGGDVCTRMITYFNSTGSWEAR